jgi:hypothetical protein
MGMGTFLLIEFVLHLPCMLVPSIFTVNQVQPLLVPYAERYHNCDVKQWGLPVCPSVP